MSLYFGIIEYPYNKHVIIYKIINTQEKDC